MQNKYTQIRSTK